MSSFSILKSSKIIEGISCFPSTWKSLIDCLENFGTSEMRFLSICSEMMWNECIRNCITEITSLMEASYHLAAMYVDRFGTENIRNIKVFAGTVFSFVHSIIGQNMEEYQYLPWSSEHRDEHISYQLDLLKFSVEKLFFYFDMRENIDMDDEINRIRMNYFLNTGKGMTESQLEMILCNYQSENGKFPSNSK